MQSARLSIISVIVAVVVVSGLSLCARADELCEIRGTVWHDLDGDGERDPGDEGLAGWTVFIDSNGNGEPDGGEKSAETADGSYSLSGLLPGAYVVAEKVKLGWRQTHPGPCGTSDGQVEGCPLDFTAEQRIRADGADIKVYQYSVPTMADWNNDGVPDLVVGEKTAMEDGKVRVYINSGSVAEALFEDFFYAKSGGADLAITAAGCLGAFPRVADWDEDGLIDLILGGSYGNVQAFINVGTTEQPTFEYRGYVQFGPPGDKTNINVVARSTVEIVDWNNDGRQDLLVGGYDGMVRLYINESIEGEPDFRAEEFIQDGVAALSVPSGRASVAVSDLDDDGRKDLIFGNTEGEVLFYRNIGTDDAPAFDGFERIQADGVDIDLPGTPRSRPFICDFNADGMTDILLGAQDGYVRLYARDLQTQPFEHKIELTSGEIRQDVDFGNEHTLTADVSGDGCVNIMDLLSIRANLGKEGSQIVPRLADVDADGMVNVMDLLAVRAGLGTGSGCP